jgi:hypothetical protein
LEVRRRYNPSYEGESLRKFLAGEPDDLSWMQAWLRMVRESTAEGRRLARVRVVDLPMSDWNRYSYALAEHNIAAGEEIRYLTRDEAPAKLPGYDYWLFDSSKLIVMRFDDADRFVGGELVEDPSEVVRANYCRDAAWHRAVRRDDFADEPSGQRA